MGTIRSIFVSSIRTVFSDIGHKTLVLFVQLPIFLNHETVRQCSIANVSQHCCAPIISAYKPEQQHGQSNYYQNRCPAPQLTTLRAAVGNSTLGSSSAKCTCPRRPCDNDPHLRLDQPVLSGFPVSRCQEAHEGLITGACSCPHPTGLEKPGRISHKTRSLT